MKTDSSTDCWSSVGSEWIEKAQTNDFRMYYIMPYTMQKLGEVYGSEILDLGCGEGGYSRELARGGAAVTSVDCSELSLSYAAFKAQEEGLKIRHLIRNSNDLFDLPDNSFDIVLCAMMLMDVEDVDGTLKEVCRVLKKDGRVFLSILHPCFKPPVEHKWVKENDTMQVVVKDYFKPAEWIGQIAGIKESVVYRHRTLSDYVKAFIKNGLNITDLNEPIPTKEQVDMSPRIAWLTKIPMYMFIELQKR